MVDFAIDTNNLQKTYGDKTAVADLTIQVQRGEVFGFLGPNGAGKSTAVKMLLGLVIPSDGTAKVLGMSPGSAKALRKIGFLPEHFRYHEWLHADELLELHAELYGIPKSVRRTRIATLLERLSLTEHAKRPLSGFSKGMLQRVGLAQALLCAPELVFLDEPTSALDPFGRMLVREVIHELKASGTTVFLNSHLLGEVEATCDRASFIKSGRVLQTVAINENEQQCVRLSVHTDTLSDGLHRKIIESGAKFLSIDDKPGSYGKRFELSVADDANIPAIADAVVQSGGKLFGLTPHRISLEETFLNIIGHEDSGQ